MAQTFGPAEQIGRGDAAIDTPETEAPAVDALPVAIAPSELGWTMIVALLGRVAWPTTDPEVAGAVWSNKGILTISDGPGGVGGWRVGQTFVVS
jgi:hypothetical protein